MEGDFTKTHIWGPFVAPGVGKVGNLFLNILTGNQGGLQEDAYETNINSDD